MENALVVPEPEPIAGEVLTPIEAAQESFLMFAYLLYEARVWPCLEPEDDEDEHE